MIWQFLWSKIELLLMLFLFLLILSKAWQLAIGQRIAFGLGKFIELIGSLLKSFWPLIMSLLRAIWIIVKWLIWLIVEFFTLLFRGLYELFQLLRQQRST
jgi:hypothetical protein